jgi:3-isopropylmalate/(R)-2-methylmalate dehydratase small subunit
MDGGINVVIAESFGPLFYDNSIRYGLLAVPLDKEKIAYIAQWSRTNPGKSIVVDLERQEIKIPGDTSFDFLVEPRVREKLLNAHTPLQEVLRHETEITAFQQSYKQSSPWVYGE